MTFEIDYPQVAMLRAVVIPPYGGDMVWAHTAAACEELRPELRALAEQLRAVHGNDYDHAATRVDPDASDAKQYREVFISRLTSCLPCSSACVRSGRSGTPAPACRPSPTTFARTA